MSKFILSIANSIASFFEAPAHSKGQEPDFGNYNEYLNNTKPTQEMLSEHSETIMSNMPLITIIILANDKSTEEISSSINSITAQSYKNIEIILTCSSQQKRLKEWADCAFLHTVCLDSSEQDLIAAAIKKTLGDYILFLPSGDTLEPDTVYQVASNINALGESLGVVYMDDDCIINGKKTNPNFKPDFSPNTLFSENYIGNAFFVKRSIYDVCGGLYGSSPESIFDYTLRATSLAHRISHIAYVGYSYAQKRPSLNQQKARSILDTHIKREKHRGHAVAGLYEGSFRLHYIIPKKSDITIIVICHGNTDILRQCLEQIEDNSTYDKYKIIIADMGIADSRLRRYYNALKNTGAAQILSFAPNTSQAKALNMCASKADSHFLIFMDYSIRILSADWMESMMECGVSKNSGTVGAKIITPDNRIVHSGYVVGMCGWWHSPFFGLPDGYNSRLFNEYVNTIRDVSALSSMCMLISSDTFNNIGCFDESFKVSGADVDLCLRLLHKRHNNIYTPYARAMFSDANYAGPVVTEQDNIRCYDMCRDMLIHGDPFYNPAYDYAATTPSIATNPYPAIRLNPNYNK